MDNNYEKESRKRSLRRYLILSLLCFVFSRIYLFFSHGISSPWMVFLFAWPLFLGALPSAVDVYGAVPGRKALLDGAEEQGKASGAAAAAGTGEAERTAEAEQGAADGSEKEITGDAADIDAVPAAKRFLAAAGEDLYPFGISAVSVGSLLQGIMEIAGTDSDYPGFLLFAGAVMLIFGTLLRLNARR